MSHEMEVREGAFLKTSGSADNWSCRVPSYDGWSSASSYPAGYCRYYGEGQGEFGFCKVYLAKIYSELINSGQITNTDLETFVSYPYQYFPMRSRLSSVLREDIKPREDGIEPENCNSCKVKTDSKSAGEVMAGVNQVIPH